MNTIILKQIRIAEAHAGGADLTKFVAKAGQAAGAVRAAPLMPNLQPYGI